MHPKVLLGDEAQLEARLGLFEIVLIFMQDRCTVCGESTIGSKIIFDASLELLGDMGLLESRFSLFRDSLSFSAR
jgi:hypothetical protein